MIIRQQQIRELGDAHFNELIRRISAGLRDQFPERTRELTEEQLHGQTRRAVEKCKRYDVRMEQDVRRFAEFCLLHGAAFDEDCVWAAGILNQPEATGNERIRQLDEYELHTLGGGPR